MAYLGKGLKSISTANITVDKMTGNGSTTTMGISLGNQIGGSVNDINVYISGVQQRPGTDYTLSGSTITFTTAPADGWPVVAISKGDSNKDDIIDSSVTSESIKDGAVTDAKITSVAASKLTGALPALDGSALTNVPSAVKSAVDPAIDSNKSLGTIWVNTTSGEVFSCTDATTDANAWTNVGSKSGDVEPTYWYGNTGLVFGGLTAGAAAHATANIEKYNQTTTGNASEFGGDLTLRRRYPVGVSDGSRVVMAGGAKEWSEIYTRMDYITVSSGANAIIFGDTTGANNDSGEFTPCSDGVRGCYAGNWSAGGGAPGNPIQYLTIQTTGNTQDFGDLQWGRYRGGGACNGTRGIIAGGYGTGARNEIDYITVQSTGNAQDFGDLDTAGRKTNGEISNSTRGIFVTDQGVSEGWPYIDYITIATTGNAQVFGDRLGSYTNCASTSNGTRFTVAGGWSGPTNTIEYLSLIHI